MLYVYTVVFVAYKIKRFLRDYWTISYVEIRFFQLRY